MPRGAALRGATITVWSFTPSRIGIMASVVVYPVSAAGCWADTGAARAKAARASSERIMESPNGGSRKALVSALVPRHCRHLHFFVVGGRLEQVVGEAPAVDLGRDHRHPDLPVLVPHFHLQREEAGGELAPKLGVAGVVGVGDAGPEVLPGTPPAAAAAPHVVAHPTGDANIDICVVLVARHQHMLAVVPGDRLMTPGGRDLGQVHAVATFPD